GPPLPPSPPAPVRAPGTVSRRLPRGAVGGRAPPAVRSDAVLRPVAEERPAARPTAPRGDRRPWGHVSGATATVPTPTPGHGALFGIRCAGARSGSGGRWG